MRPPASALPVKERESDKSFYNDRKFRQNKIIHAGKHQHPAPDACINAFCECHTTYSQVNLIKSCYFLDWCSQASTQTTCPQVSRTSGTSQNKKIFQVDFTDLLRPCPLHFPTICLQSNYQHVEVWTVCPCRRDDSCFTATLPTINPLNWTKDESFQKMPRSAES